MQETIATCDASKYAVGAVSEQKRGKRFHSVAYTSRTLSNAEQNYVAHETELLSILKLFKIWRAYLHGGNFTAYFDHYPLKYLETGSGLSSRQVQRLETIVASSFTIIIAIRKNSESVADALSRQSSQIEEDTLRNTKLPVKAIQRTNRTGPLETKAIMYGTKYSKDYGTLKNEYKMDNEIKDLDLAPRKPFTVSKNFLYYNNRFASLNGNLDWNYFLTCTSLGKMDTQDSKNLWQEWFQTSVEEKRKTLSKNMSSHAKYVNEAGRRISNHLDIWSH